MIVADTSFLFSLYGTDAHSLRAIDWLKKHHEVVTITSLTEFELANAIRFASFRKLIPTKDANLYWQQYSQDRDAGRISLRPANLANILTIAGKLSEQFTSRKGHRSFDILHVAGAIELEAKVFLTFDRNQITLAKSQKLTVPIAP